MCWPEGWLSFGIYYIKLTDSFTAATMMMITHCIETAHGTLNSTQSIFLQRLHPLLTANIHLNQWKCKAALIHDYSGWWESCKFICTFIGLLHRFIRLHGWSLCKEIRHFATIFANIRHPSGRLQVLLTSIQTKWLEWLLCYCYRLCGFRWQEGV